MDDPTVQADSQMTAATLGLALGGLGIYLATRLGTHALIGRRGFDSARAGTVALGHWIPTCIISVIALQQGRPDLAVGLVFGTSVAALSLAIGMICFLTPGDPTPPTRRAWPFLVPAALLVLLAGFGGSLRVVHAVMLAVFGAAVWLVWRSTVNDTSAAEAEELVSAVQAAEALPAVTMSEMSAGLPTANGINPEAADPASASSQFPNRRIVQGGAALILAGVGAWFVINGTLNGEGLSPVFRVSLMASGVISPLLTLPLLAAGTDMAQRNRAGEACSACVGIALLNLLALLPALIIFWWIRQAWLGGAWPVAKLILPDSATRWDAIDLLLRRLPAIPLPMMIWRVDTVVLAIVGVMLLPAAMGAWRIRRLEAIFLILCYAGYLAVTAYMVARSGAV
jgi:Ca2+/Na+ antiporter